MTIQSALNEIGIIFKTTADQFRTLRSSEVPKFSGVGDAAIVEEFLDGIEMGIAGMIEWSFQSERYFGKDGQQRKKDRVLTI